MLHKPLGVSNDVSKSECDELSGHYMLWYFDKNPGTSGQVISQIESPAQKVQGNQCLSFHYQNVRHAKGYPITLNVYAIYSNGTEMPTTWSSTFSYGYKWSVVKRSLALTVNQDTEASFKVSFSH
jgi:MAM domain, meprin/A5/mu